MRNSYVLLCIYGRMYHSSTVAHSKLLVFSALGHCVYHESNKRLSQNNHKNNSVMTLIDVTIFIESNVARKQYS